MEKISQIKKWQYRHSKFSKTCNLDDAVTVLGSRNRFTFSIFNSFDSQNKIDEPLRNCRSLHDELRRTKLKKVDAWRHYERSGYQTVSLRGASFVNPVTDCLSHLCQPDTTSRSNESLRSHVRLQQ